MKSGRMQLPLAPSPSTPAGRLVSYSLPGPGLTPAGFLQHALGHERFYWQDARQPITYAGFGVAAELFAWGENRFSDIQRQAAALFAGAVRQGPAPAGPRLIGGFAFRDDFTPDNTWTEFHPAHFILPHFQLVQSGADCWLTINAILPADEDPAGTLPQLAAALQARRDWLRQQLPPPPAVMPPPAGVHFPLSLADWSAKINEATGQMAGGPLQKVVLSRVCELRYPGQVDVDHALAYLDDHYPGCYRFLFEPRPGHAFFGASPELLAQVRGDQVATMALAGSIGRGATPAEDARLAADLLAGDKEQREHQMVVAAIRHRLASLVRDLCVPPTGVLTLSNIQHLHTPISGHLRTPAGVIPLVELLHPTPALGGQPRDLALAFIQQAEPVPRGWFAAPIGWIDADLDGTFAVAIRSAVAQAHRVWLYAGAGIVAGSDANKEWAETNLKFRPILHALGVTA